MSHTLPGPDLLARTAALVDIPSVSHEESALVDHLEAELRAVAWLAVDRIGDNLVARTELGRDLRIVLGGHSDTVPPNGNDAARIDGDTLWGLGAADMKGGIAVIMGLATSVTEPAVDVTYVIYAREEIALVHNGLRELFQQRPDLLACDAAILGEPTGGSVEAGCQGTMRHRLRLVGARAHTARAWMGRNAIHRLGPVLATIAAYEPRTPTIDGCTFHEALQAVQVTGGVAGNVVPDEVELVINHRWAPDRTSAEAATEVESIMGRHLEPGDELELIDMSPAAAPGLEQPVLRRLIGDLDVRAKLGWTDVAFFAERGVPAVNFGPGDPTLAHTAEERVDRSALEHADEVLRKLLG